MFYSKSTGGFYPKALIAEYISAGTLPTDLSEISEADHRALVAGQSDGKRIVADNEGRPSLEDQPAPTHAELVEQTKATARAMRLPIIGILDGMQSSALTDSDFGRAKAIETAKIGLKNITKVDLSGCTTADEMRAVVLAAYKALADAAPFEVKTAFAQALI
jgi:hypothetical protein